MIPFMTEEIYQNIVRKVDASAPESIHLCDFPAWEEAHIDKELEANMDQVLKIVVMGRACRNTSNIKNRQPIGQMFVKSERALSEFFADIITDELNVKKVAPFRRVYQEFFPGIDKYFSPFLVANQTLHFKNKEIRDILPENNEGIPLVPQILTNKPYEMIWAIKELRTYGYREINLNLGCSMPQVARRGRGAGFLKDKDQLNLFFKEVFDGLEGMDVELSVKTRLGKTSAQEAMELMEIYNRYPISELIIHPRLMSDLYRATPDMDTFAAMYEMSSHPVCYNGDIYTVADLQRMENRFPELDRIMVGRGFLRDPSLLCQMQGKGAVAGEKLLQYHNVIFQNYLQIMQDERQAIGKMKEIWTYWQTSFPGHEREFKKLRKSAAADQYMEYVRGIMCDTAV